MSDKKKNIEIESILESILFVCGDPISFQKLSKAVSVECNNKFELILKNLSEKYRKEKRGLRILIKNNKAQMTTSMENSKYVENFIKSDIKGNLGNAALEVISIIAYRGPITKSEIENIRGVNCSFTIRHLMIRGLIEKTNNYVDTKANVYRISFDFLKRFGIEKVEDLPKYNEFRELFNERNLSE